MIAMYIYYYTYIQYLPQLADVLAKILFHSGISINIQVNDAILDRRTQFSLLWCTPDQVLHLQDPIAGLIQKVIYW